MSTLQYTRRVKSITVAAIISPLFALSGQAADGESVHSYSYAQIGYVHDNFNSNGARITDGEGLTGQLQEGTGNGLGGTVSVTLPAKFGGLGFHLVADYSKTSHDVAIGFAGNLDAAGIVGVSQRELRMALGMHYAIGDTTSLFSEIGLVKMESKLGDFNVLNPLNELVTGNLDGASGSAAGMDFKAGLRQAFGRFEVMGYGRYHGQGSINGGPAEAIDWSSKFKAGAGVVYHFTAHLQVAADYEFSSPGKLRLLARYAF